MSLDWQSLRLQNAASRCRQFVSEAMRDKLEAPSGSAKPWMKSFGPLRNLHKETARINRLMENEFEPMEES